MENVVDEKKEEEGESWTAFLKFLFMNTNLILLEIRKEHLLFYDQSSLLWKWIINMTEIMLNLISFYFTANCWLYINTLWYCRALCEEMFSN